MTGSLPSEELEELIAGYVLGDLSAEEAEALEQRFAANPELQPEVAQLQEVMALLPYALPEVQPSPQLRAAVLAEAQRAHLPTKRTARPWSRIAAGIAAIVALAIGLDNYRLRQELDRSQLQARQQAEITAILQSSARLVSLKGVETAPMSGSVVLAPDRATFAIAAKLPHLPENQIYRLWAVEGEKKTACGQFNATAKGTVLDRFAIPAECSLSTAKLVVTREPFPSPPQPVGTAVLVGEG
jgi:anti-sigma-K factor RskA